MADIKQAPKPSVRTVSSGMSFGSVLFLIFLTLKLTGVITWSWWFITMPLWLGWVILLGALLGFGIIALIVLGIAAIFDSK